MYRELGKTENSMGSVSMNEFQLIQQQFARLQLTASDVLVGIGDDAAILQCAPDTNLVISADMLVAGVHFPLDTSAEDVGYKSLAVNVSDMAAMGATPRFYTLSISLPNANEDWLQSFTKGLSVAALPFSISLIGGDTTQGPLTISIQILGSLPKNKGLLRSGAKVGDMIYVTGQLGDAGLALLHLQGELTLPKQHRDAALQRLNRPTPRVAAGIALLDYASAAIDISDGLAADLGHILAASGVGASIDAFRLPISEALRASFHQAGGWALPLSAGDDYELCFTVPEEHQAQVEQKMAECQIPCTWIGFIESREGLRCLLEDGTDITPSRRGFQHF